MKLDVSISDLKGKTIDRIEGLEKGSLEVLVFTTCGYKYSFFHIQDCCERVDLYDFDGCQEDLSGALVVSAEEVVSDCEGDLPESSDDSWTWTFYKIETNKGGVWMRWLGQSNGYYSEGIDITREVTHENKAN